MSLQIFGKQQKIYTFLILFGAVIILLIVLIVHPLLREIKKNSEELLLQKTNLISFSEEIKNLGISKELYEKNRLNLEKISPLLIDPEIPIEFIGFLEKNASDSQLSIEISSMATAKKENELWPSLTFQILVAGPSPNFLKFLEKLENSPYLIEILNFNLKKISGKEGIPSGSINAALLIKVFTK